jgi:hypothetical protein
MQFKSRNWPWLAVLSGMVGMALVGGGVDPITATALLSGLGAAAAVSFMRDGNPQPRQVMDKITRVPRRALLKTSSSARAAVERATKRGEYIDPDLALLDVGLISTQTTEEGMKMSKARTVSKDDDGVRPFITLHVEPADADRQAVVRFEIIDQRGNRQYMYDMQIYLREGDVNIITDTQLPLLGNAQISGTGDWDLRVYVDNRLAGVHTFALAPSFDERMNRVADLSADRAQQRYDYMRRQRLKSEADEREELAQEDSDPVALDTLMRNAPRNSTRRG